MVRPLLACIFAASCLPAAALADDELYRVRERMRLEVGMDDSGWASLEPQVRLHLDRKRRGDEVADLVRDLHREGCVGACLSEAVRAYNGARNRGIGWESSRGILLHEFREQNRERVRGGYGWDGGEMGRRLRIRVESRVRLEEGDDDSGGRGRGRSGSDDRSDDDTSGGRGRGGGKGRR